MNWAQHVTRSDIDFYEMNFVDLKPRISLLVTVQNGTAFSAVDRWPVS